MSKLYATTTSEKASKGQGGNEYLEIKLTVGSAKNVIDFGTLILDQREDENGNKEAFVLTYNGGEIASYNPNGDTCPNYPNDKILPDEDGNCSLCGDDMHHKGKGEKQKGERCRGCFDCEAPTGNACGTTPNA